MAKHILKNTRNTLVVKIVDAGDTIDFADGNSVINDDGDTANPIKYNIREIYFQVDPPSPDATEVDIERNGVKIAGLHHSLHWDFTKSAFTLNEENDFPIVLNKINIGGFTLILVLDKLYS